jgi:hypothetical protein
VRRGGRAARRGGGRGAAGAAAEGGDLGAERGEEGGEGVRGEGAERDEGIGGAVVEEGRAAPGVPAGVERAGVRARAAGGVVLGGGDEADEVPDLPRARVRARGSCADGLAHARACGAARVVRG